MLRYQDETRQRTRWLIGGVAILLVTWGLQAFSVGHHLANWSYDLPFLFRDHTVDTNVVVVVEDRPTLDALGETGFPPSRKIHARLVDRLREEGAKLVVLDISFRTAKPAEDEVFAAAIRHHGGVILGGVLETTMRQSHGGITSVVETKPPTDQLREAAADWGLLVVGDLDAGFSVRRIITQWEELPTVPWLAASYAGMLETNENQKAERWLNCYGVSPAFDQITLGQVLGVDGQNLPPGLLRGKVVFAGFDSTMRPAREERDVFATPYTRMGRGFAPGVEILANVYANLANHDWLSQLPLPGQCALAVIFGAITFFSLLYVGPKTRWVVAFLVLLAVVVFSIALQWRFHWWWNWCAVAMVQLPLTLLLITLCPRLPVVAFISYRRDLGKDFAVALLMQLRARRKEALIDLTEIQGGRFPDKIYRMIDRVSTVLLVLSPGALNDRIRSSDDWLRKEIEYSLSEGKHILPIFLEDFDDASYRKLPPELSALSDVHGFEHHLNTWDATLGWVESQLKNPDTSGARRAR